MFGNTLEEVMDLQKDRFPYRKLPWIQVTLTQQVDESLQFLSIAIDLTLLAVILIHFHIYCLL